MAYLYDYITELSLGNDADLEKIFNLSLMQVFSNQYLSKINSVIKNKINIKEKTSTDPNIVAWVEGTTIYINTLEFNARDMKSKIKYILHEFMHVLNNSKSFIFLSKFKEIKDLSNNLWVIIKKHSKNPGKFLTSKNIKSNYFNSQESLSYLMNDAIDWNQISSEGKSLIINTLKKSNVFNLESVFWKKRLQ